MPGIKAQGSLFRIWESLIGACERNIGLLPGVEALKEELEALLAATRELKIVQETLTGRRKAVTQQMGQNFDDGKEKVRRIRSFVVTCLGSYAEQLTQFGITPNRTRKRKVKLPEPAPPPETATSAPAEDATAPTASLSASESGPETPR
jgi:hypothetical protein